MRRFGSMAMVVVATMVLGAAASDAGAKEAKGSANASLGVFGTYVWRGQQLSDAVVLQPSVSLTSGPVGVSLWGNYDTDLETMNETDFTLTYSRGVGPVSVSLGYIYYGLEGLEDTQEVYVTAGLDTLLAPTLTVYYDFDEGDGFFATLAASHAFDLPAGMELKLGASASYDGGNDIMGVDADGDAIDAFYSGEVSAAVGIPLGAGLSLEPRVAYAFPLSGEAKDVLEAISPDGEADIFYAGVTLALSF